MKKMRRSQPRNMHVPIRSFGSLPQVLATATTTLPAPTSACTAVRETWRVTRCTISHIVHVKAQSSTETVEQVDGAGGHVNLHMARIHHHQLLLDAKQSLLNTHSVALSQQLRNKSKCALFSTEIGIHIPVPSHVLRGACPYAGATPYRGSVMIRLVSFRQGPSRCVVVHWRSW